MKDLRLHSNLNIDSAGKPPVFEPRSTKEYNFGPLWNSAPACFALPA